MRSRALAALSVMALLVAACGSSGGTAASATPSGLLPGAGASSAKSLPPRPSGATDPTSAPVASPTPAATPTGGGTGLVVLHGTFSGHGSDPLASADQTVALELHWNAGPDDVHDSKAFRLVSGTFTFSEVIAGVCGGSRSEAGALMPFSDTTLTSSDLQDRDRASVSLVDARLSSGAVELSLTSSFAVSTPDPDGCADLSRTGVGICTLVFPQIAIGELQRDATCSDASRNVEWTGRLAP